MKIHEYQAKEILKRYGVSVPKGVIGDNINDLLEKSEIIENPIKVVKAQIHAGGRGKGGGVKVAKNRDELKQYCENILGMQLVTHQTGLEGKKVNLLLVEEGCNIEKEFYLGMVLDRAIGRLVMMVSTEGGMEIEKVAEESPELIFKESIDPLTGLLPFQARELAFKLGLKGKIISKAVTFMLALSKSFIDTDASLIEINPLVLTKEGDLIALDAKMSFDDNALYRHPEIIQYRDLTEEDSKEIEAKKYDLSYIALDGDIGCMVNGAGLAMATMDIIKQLGGEPANFLDVGGSATKEKVTEAFKIIVSDPKVKGIFVNIFGGIMKCDIIAEGIIAATSELGITVPLVVRLEGTNVEKGKALLNSSGLSIISADDMKDGAFKIVSAIK